jgi:hypothetical protein
MSNDSEKIGIWLGELLDLDFIRVLKDIENQ